MAALDDDTKDAKWLVWGGISAGLAGVCGYSFLTLNKQASFEYDQSLARRPARPPGIEGYTTYIHVQHTHPSYHSLRLYSPKTIPAQLRALHRLLH